MNTHDGNGQVIIDKFTKQPQSIWARHGVFDCSNYRNVFLNVVNMMYILKQDGTLKYLKTRLMESPHCAPDLENTASIESDGCRLAIFDGLSLARFLGLDLKDKG